MIHIFGQRISAALSAVGILGLLSPLVLAAVMFVTQQTV